MRKFEYISKDFNKQKTAQYKLSVQFNKFEYGYSIYSISLKKFIVVKFDLIPDKIQDETSKLAYVFDKESLLKQNYKETAFIYSTPNATLIPEELFNEENKEIFYAYNYFLAPGDSVLHNKIENKKIVSLFAFPEKLKAVLAQNLTKYQIFHQYTSFIESSILAGKQEENKKEVFINLSNDFFLICVVQNQNLIFNNSFHFKSIDDFIYYIHLVLKNLKINYKNIPITLSGNISKKVGTYKVLNQFFTNTKFKEDFPKAAFSKDLKLDKHYFDNLIYITV